MSYFNLTSHHSQLTSYILHLTSHSLHLDAALGVEADMTEWVAVALQAQAQRIRNGPQGLAVSMGLPPATTGIRAEDPATAQRAQRPKRKTFIDLSKR